MSVFAIADLHLSFGTDKPMEIFPGWEDHTTRLERNWNKIIGEKDSVVISGDVSWAMRLDNAVADFDYINRLNGKKYIVKGNHDYWWTTKSKMDSFLQRNNFDTINIVHNNAFRCGNTIICGTRGWFYDSPQEDEKILLREAQRLRTSIEYGLNNLAAGDNIIPTVFLHYPPVYDNYVCTEIMEVLKQYNIKKCYYGHLHGKAIYCAYIGDYEGIEMRLISSDSLKFMPCFVE